MKKLILIISLQLILQSTTSSQGNGEPFNPETANGAKYIHSTGHRLLWENPDSTVFNIIYFGSDSVLVVQSDPSVILYDGSHNVAYDTVYLNLVEPLAWNKKYFWKVVEYYHSGSVEGPVWSFRTMQNPICEYEIFFDDFENGLSNWSVINDGGNCVWEIFTPPYPNPYTLPFASAGGVLAADSYECGNSTTMLTTITLNNTVGSGFYGKILEFDTDWRIVDVQDEAYVEVSTDGGENWEIVWSQIGTDLRNSHEFIPINIVEEILIRFKVVQPGWDWWWVIDNVFIRQNCPLTEFYPPHNLKLNTIPQPSPRVELNWEKFGLFYASNFYIERKIGLPTDPGIYDTIGIVPYAITNFIDSTVEKKQIYTYCIKEYPGPGGISSNEATAYIPDIITSIENKKMLPTEFVLYQNYPNPFNPSTKIKFSIPNVETRHASSLQMVTLKVYDVIGTEIATLVNEEKPAGEYEVEFNPASGIRNLVSGIYFYQLKSGNFVVTKKMILLK